MMHNVLNLFVGLDVSGVIASLICGYFFYYFYKVVHRPVLIVGDGEFKNKLIRHLDVLNEHFWPTFWAFSTHFQTIGRVLFKSKPFVPYRRETLITTDNGHISLDWIDNDDNKLFPDPKTRPTVVVMPGITGCSDASYVRHIAKESESLGCRVLVFINRGLGKTVLKTPRTFSACNAEDLEFVLAHISKQYPDSPLIMFAVSLGGLIFTNYAAIGDHKANISGAFVVSVPWDPVKSSYSLEKPVNKFLYNNFLTYKLKELIKLNWHVFQENICKLPYKLEDVMKTTTIREFDDVFTAKTFGYPSHEEYYTESSLILKPLENIKIPMLFLNAKDDPFSPGESIPLEAIKNNPNMALILTDYGGHIGFVEGLTVRDRSFVERLFNQYIKCLLNLN
ncbi:phospholipase ABHD3 isoform X1 [Hydra vulgaris]|uniref:phospholipase ABHD3 isoform X1 n=1 Tax=Hydra vulgaris TaxID=6087 RepID=UPI0006415BE9|nr:phospholipase ABHD3 isoform X1 [Hydra vulgaris]